jgi:hypothetical protein
MYVCVCVCVYVCVYVCVCVGDIYGAVLFAEKALVVGRLQIAFDPNFFPFIDKKSDNPVSAERAYMISGTVLIEM